MKKGANIMRRIALSTVQEETLKRNREVNMSYTCSDPKSWEGKTVPNGQCVAFVKASAGAPATDSWTEGEKVVKGMNLPKGTAIATFIGGKYPSKPTGNHAAIYSHQDAQGIYVYQQYFSSREKKQYPVHLKLLAWNVPPGTYIARDGSKYSVIE